MPGNVFDRPFQPVALEESEISVFALSTLGNQLREEKAYREHGADSLTLVRSEGLNVVLTVFREGQCCAPHRTQASTTILVLEGDLSILGPGEEEIRVEEGTAAALPADFIHRIQANVDSKFLTVIGRQ